MTAILSEYYTLFVIVILAFITPLIFTRTGIPVVVGEILLGLGVGTVMFVTYSLFDVELLEVGEAIGFLAKIGFIFLMFLSGLEIDFGKIESGGNRAVAKGTVMFLMTLLIALPLTAWVVGSTSIHFDSMYMTIVLSTTSVAIVLSVVREMHMSQTRYGQEIIITALIADIGAMILITIYAIRYEVLSTGDVTFGVVAVAIFLLIFIMFYVVYRLGSYAMWWYPAVMKKFFQSDDPHELGVRASRAIIFTFFAISAVVDSEALAVLGAFLAGAVVSLMFQEGAILSKKLYGIGYGFLVPIFFINLGITFNFDAIFNVEALLLIPLLFGIVIVAKILPAIILSTKGDLKRNLASGVLMTGGLTLMIAGGEIGLSLGIIDETAHAVTILLAVIISIITPTLFNILFQRFHLEEKG